MRILKSLLVSLFLLGSMSSYAVGSGTVNLLENLLKNSDVMFQGVAKSGAPQSQLQRSTAIAMDNFFGGGNFSIAKLEARAKDSDVSKADKKDFKKLVDLLSGDSSDRDAVIEAHNLLVNLSQRYGVRRSASRCVTCEKGNFPEKVTMILMDSASSNDEKAINWMAKATKGQSQKTIRDERQTQLKILGDLFGVKVDQNLSVRAKSQHQKDALDKLIGFAKTYGPEHHKFKLAKNLFLISLDSKGKVNFFTGKNEFRSLAVLEGDLSNRQVKEWNKMTDEMLALMEEDKSLTNHEAFQRMLENRAEVIIKKEELDADAASSLRNKAKQVDDMNCFRRQS